jgi:hypothetical protein
MLQSAEVIEVFLKDDIPNYYTIRFKYLNRPGNNDENTNTAYPLNAHVKSIPVPGEIVLIVMAASSFAGNFRLNEGIPYYMNDVNIQSNINYNGVPTSGKVPISNTTSFQNASFGVVSSPNQSQPERAKKTFKPLEGQNALQLFEGDVVIEGRSGNSVRLSSTINNTSDVTKQPTWTSGNPGDPILIISNTKKNISSKGFRIEDINKDDSSIYLSSRQRIPLKLANKSAEINVENYTKPQVVINSDRLVFNSKVDSIIMSAKKDIFFSTNNSKTSVDLIAEALEILARGTFPTAVGPTGPHPQLAEILKKLKNI